MSNLEQQRKDLTKRILDKVAADSKFREAMANDPVGALDSAGFNKEIHDLEEQANKAEVAGYARPQWGDSWGCI
ncbi:MAG TPA: hypothetical protein VKR06_30900 [Ktedonosporobacter sp.]|nr:hypothetical protein [Ktedonosporobacter sp.]